MRVYARSSVRKNYSPSVQFKNVLHSHEHGRFGFIFSIQSLISSEWSAHNKLKLLRFGYILTYTKFTKIGGGHLVVRSLVSQFPELTSTSLEKHAATSSHFCRTLSSICERRPIGLTYYSWRGTCWSTYQRQRNIPDPETMRHDRTMIPRVCGTRSIRSG